LIIDYQFPVDYDEANLSSVAARAFLLSWNETINTIDKLEISRNLPDFEDFVVELEVIVESSRKCVKWMIV
jgi:hypothetical protein